MKDKGYRSRVPKKKSHAHPPRFTSPNGGCAMRMRINDVLSGAGALTMKDKNKRHIYFKLSAISSIAATSLPQQ